MTKELPPEIQKELAELPPLSDCTIKLFQIMGKEDHSLMEMGEVIEKDGPMSVRVLRVVNSAAFPTRKEVTSVRHAVSYLGERLVMGLAINESSGKAINKKLEGYGLEAGELWDMGLWTALASQQINKYTKHKTEDGSTFTAALLHDVGKIILSKFLEGSIPDAIKDMADEQIKDYLALEIEFLNTSHCEVGEELGRQWKLPTAIINVIRFHHNPAEAPEDFRELCYSVYLSDLLSYAKGQDDIGPAFFSKIDEGYLNYFSLNEETIETILSDVTDAYEREKKMYSQ